MGITKYNKVVYMSEKKKMRKEWIFFGVVLIFSLSFNLLSSAYAEPQITFNTKNTSYGHDLIIRAYGFTPNSEYLIKLIMPNGLEIHLKQGLTNGDDFGVIQPIEFGAVVGNYTVIIETESEKATNFFTITREPYSTQQTITVEEKEFVTNYTPYVGNVGSNLEETLEQQKERIINESGNVTTASTNEILEKPVKEIPSWVKEVFKMWANGQITDTDLINGIQYLIKIEVIVV
mgnify:CR=1 FL=1